MHNKNADSKQLEWAQARIRARAQTGYPKVTIVGAGNVGANTALLLLLKQIADVVLVDVVEGLAQGKALDIMQMRSIEQFGPIICGSDNYTASANSDIVVVTAGVPRKPGMKREDLLRVNAGIVRSVLDGALPLSPNAIFIFVTNPLDVMVNLAFELADLPKNRLFGMGGVLDSTRFIHAISKATGAAPAQIEAMVIGAHGEAMLPLPRFAKVNGKPLETLLDAQQIADVVRATIDGGAQIVELLKTGSAFYAPAASIVRMVSEILAPTNSLLSVCARLTGEYGIDGLHLCVPVELDRQGVARVVELDLSATELAQLAHSAQATKAQLTELITP